MHQIAPVLVDTFVAVAISAEINLEVIVVAELVLAVPLWLYWRVPASALSPLLAQDLPTSLADIDALALAALSEVVRLPHVGGQAHGFEDEAVVRGLRHDAVAPAPPHPATVRTKLGGSRSFRKIVRGLRTVKVV